jgi:hypothetical protein
LQKSPTKNLLLKNNDAQARVDAVKARVAQNQAEQKNLLLTLKLMLKQN